MSFHRRGLKGIGLGRFGIGKAASPETGFPKTLSVSDFLSATYTLSTSFTDAGEFTVPAQQAYQYGQGVTDSRNQGYIYIFMRDFLAAEITGKMRFTYSDNNKFDRSVIYEEEGETLHGDVNDVDQKKPFPLAPWLNSATGKAHENDLLIWEVEGDSADVISNTNTIIWLPATFFKDRAN